MKKNTFILLLCATFSLISCDKETTTEPDENPVVYVAGSVGTKDVRYATIWKNGVVTALTDKTDLNKAATVNSIYVDNNNNIYAAGYALKEGYESAFAVMWKNGKEIELTDGEKFAMANSIYVAGGKVYATGSQSKSGESVATLWVDGVAKDLTDNITSSAKAVCVTGNDVYVVGVCSQKAVIWKNGVATNLTDGTNRAEAVAIYVSGNDVYILGSERNIENNSIIKVWKNGVATNLTDGKTWVNPTSIFVSGNDVYVTGNEDSEQGSIAKLWKNGVATTLLSHPTNNCYASSVYVKGSDVYVTVTEHQDLFKTTAKLWKNGEMTNLTDGENDNSDANAIFVK